MSFTSHLLAFLFGGISSIVTVVLVFYLVLLKKISKNETISKTKFHQQSANDVTSGLLDFASNTNPAYAKPNTSESVEQIKDKIQIPPRSVETELRSPREKSKHKDPIQKVQLFLFIM